MQYVEITQQNIQYTETQCTDTCSTIYETQMGTLYENLRLCLDGKPPINSGGDIVQPNTNTDKPLVPVTTTVIAEITTVDIGTEPNETTTQKAPSAQ